MIAPPTSQDFDMADAQTRIVRASYLGMILKDMMVGGMMIMFATHVLGYTSGQSSILTALAPLILLARYPFLDVVNRLPRFNVMFWGRVIQIVLILLLLVIPPEMLTLWVMLPIASAFVISNEFLLNAVFLPAVTEVTNERERGAFLGRLRSTTQTFGLIYNLGILLIVGDILEHGEHRILLLVALVGLANALLWLAPLKDTPERQFPARSGRTIMNVLGTSPLMRRPLAISLIKSIWEWPILIIYLLNGLNMPAYIMSLFIVLRSIGAITAVRFWGRQADRKGFRATFIYSFGLALALYPILFFIPDFAQIADQSFAFYGGVFAVSVFAFFMGILTAGQNVANTLYFTAHLKEGQGFYALNLLTALTTVFLSALTALGGIALVKLEGAGLVTAHPLLGGLLWTDTFRILLIAFLSILLLIGLYLSAKISLKIPSSPVSPAVGGTN